MASQSLQAALPEATQQRRGAGAGQETDDARQTPQQVARPARLHLRDLRLTGGEETVKSLADVALNMASSESDGAVRRSRPSFASIQGCVFTPGSV